MTTYATIVTLLLVFVFFRSLYVLGKKEEFLQIVLAEAEAEINKREAMLHHLYQRNWEGK